MVYFGTYTGASSKGIYSSILDTKTGQLSAPRLDAEVASPAFLALHPKGHILYAVNEVDVFKDPAAGGVSAFAITPETGALKLLNQESSGGTGPCHLTVDATGSAVLVANYGGGSVAVLPIRAGGELAPVSSLIQHTGSSVNPRRQTAPHAHGVYLNAANRFAYVPDLGLDKLLIYRWTTNGIALTPNDPPAFRLPPGAGPRHFTFHPNGRFAYVINELSNTVTALTCDASTGILREFQTITTLPDDYKDPNSTAEIAVHPSGRFLYGSNRGHNSLAIYAIEPDSGKLRLLKHEPTQGRTPRNFAIDPTGAWLLAANQDSDSVVVFRIEPQTGLLHPTDHSIDVPTPVCILFR
jgi:6-phosphogluconolactonase